jgi:hypothetical protein
MASIFSTTKETNIRQGRKNSTTMTIFGMNAYLYETHAKSGGAELKDVYI